ncbi:hypothetical protein vBSlqSZDD2_68 [Serratia phage vB_SlqS_ZDD2]|nr:hypothetical protein vBSlqSZDD2_68 [Serratia phage vB_SlqS_ZDD2]
MAQWGAMFVDDQGIPWYTPGTVPMQFIEKITSWNTYDSIYYDQSKPTVFATRCYDSGVGCFLKYQEPGRISIETRTSLQNKDLRHDIYKFSIVPQGLSQWGVNIWDASGNIIINNLTPVMRAPDRHGDPENPNDSGYMISRYLEGQHAVIPMTTGYATGVIHTGGGGPGGGVMPFMSEVVSTCQDLGNGTTRVTHATYQVASGAITNLTYTNSRNWVFTINVAGL